jgi:hypothetical protein
VEQPCCHTRHRIEPRTKSSQAVGCRRHRRRSRTGGVPRRNRRRRRRDPFKSVPDSAATPPVAGLHLQFGEDAAPEFAASAPLDRGRAPFTFTSFGDLDMPTLGKKYMPPAGVTLPNPPYVNDNLGSLAAGDTTLGVERLQPLFHVFNGDLCCANLAEDRVRTWSPTEQPFVS